MVETQTERSSGLELRDSFSILSQRRWTATDRRTLDRLLSSIKVAP